MARNMACINEDGTNAVCAGDGHGGCVACDDGKGNYQPLDALQSDGGDPSRCCPDCEHIFCICSEADAVVAK